MLTISSGSRAGSEDEDDNFGGSFNTSFNTSFGASLGTSFGGLPTPRTGSRGSEDSGEREQTPTPTTNTTQGSQESAGLRGVFEEIVRTRSPPALIYLSN